MGRSSKKPEKSRKNGTKRILVRLKGCTSRSAVQQEISRTIIQMQEYGLRRLSCGVFILTFQVIRGIINATYYGGDIMCDVKKYEKIYEDIQKLQPEDTLQLVLEAETEEQRSFYEMVGDFLLQKRQRQVIERNLF